VKTKGNLPPFSMSHNLSHVSAYHVTFFSSVSRLTCLLYSPLLFLHPVSLLMAYRHKVCVFCFVFEKQHDSSCLDHTMPFVYDGLCKLALLLLIHAEGHLRARLDGGNAMKRKEPIRMKHKGPMGSKHIHPKRTET
jgi:hypothetical protein